MQSSLEKFKFLAEEAFHHALEEMDPAVLLREHLLREDRAVRVAGRLWPGAGRLAVAAAGKAAPALAEGAARILGDRIDAGLVVSGAEGLQKNPAPPGFETYVAEHPVPGTGSERAAAALGALADSLDRDDLLLFLLSGGATAMTAAPAPPLSLDDLRRTFQALLAGGADIVDMNVVRKHLTTLGGGRLAQRAHPAAIETLAISDVPTDDPSTIGSGPTVPDFSTYALALGVLERFGLEKTVSERVMRYLQDGVRGARPETPKRGEPCFLTSRYTLLATARKLLEKMARHLALLPRVEIWEADQLGGVDYQAARHVKQIQKLKAAHAGPVALLSAGESTLQIGARESGLGGRCSHLALRLALEAERAGLSSYIFLAGATDGRDGNTGAAGAVATHESLPHARKMGVRPEAYLERFDSYRFFEQTNELLHAPRTRTNLSDVRLLIAW